MAAKVEAPLLPKANRALWEEDDATEDAEAQQLSAAVQLWVQSRKDTASKKMSEILSQVQTDVDGSLSKLEAQVQREAKDAAKSVKQEFAGLEKELVEKYAEIKQISAKYNTEISKAWEEYSAIYERLTDVKTNASMAAEKRKSGLKRKLSQAQGELNGVMAEAEKKLAKCRANTSKMPGVLKMLQSIM